MPHDSEFDYVIVGAGSAGCVLANRLTSDPDIAVLLLEAGPADRSIAIHMPAAFTYARGARRFDWGYKTEPELHAGNRRIECPRGRVLGGSSSVNAMSFVRGHPADFDRWAGEESLSEWSYVHCLPYFRKMESFNGGEDRFRGGSGPLSVTAPRFSNPLCEVFLRACGQAGYPLSADTNGEQPEGFGPMIKLFTRGVE